MRTDDEDDGACRRLLNINIWWGVVGEWTGADEVRDQ